jgi:hypothetical protein
MIDFYSKRPEAHAARRGFAGGSTTGSCSTVRSTFRGVHLITQSVCVTLVNRATYSLSEMPNVASTVDISTLCATDASLDGDQSPAATRVTLRPHDPATGEEIDKRQVVKGYEYARGEFVTFTAEELKGLDVESSKVIDLEKFAPRNDIDPVY